MKWAILSGIEGNLTAYEAVLQDIRRQSVSDLYILGDVVGLQGDNEAVMQRLQAPQPGELLPQVGVGWWEEQCFSVRGERSAGCARTDGEIWWGWGESLVGIRITGVGAVVAIAALWFP